MKRREFLTRVTIGGVTLPLLFTELGCSDDDGGGPDGGAETFTSLSDQTGHSHTIVIPDADIAAGGAHAYTSSNTGHTHQVSFSESDVDYLAVGCAVTVESSEDAGHRHVWRVSYPDLSSDISRTSTIDATGHTHRVTIPAGDLNQPVGVHNYTTTSGSGHTHEVTLTQLQLVELSECDSITAETTPDGTGHTHSFFLARP
jgi:hypothetical protein